MTQKKLLGASVCLALCTLVSMPPARAIDGVVTVDILRTLVTNDGRWGGCMVHISPDLSLSGCTRGWLSFGCTTEDEDAPTGYWHSISGWRMLDQAQLALATNKQVKMFFSDRPIYNGYCTAWRIDVIQ